MFVLLFDQITLQCLDSLLIYDRDIYQLHTKVNGIEDSDITKQ